MGEGKGEKIFYLTARNTTQPLLRMHWPVCGRQTRRFPCAA